MAALRRRDHPLTLRQKTPEADLAHTPDRPWYRAICRGMFARPDAL
jgi:hypothetical protein